MSTNNETIFKFTSDFEIFTVPLKETIDLDWTGQLKNLIFALGEDPQNFQNEIISLFKFT